MFVRFMEFFFSGMRLYVWYTYISAIKYLLSFVYFKFSTIDFSFFSSILFTFQSVSDMKSFFLFLGYLSSSPYT